MVKHFMDNEKIELDGNIVLVTGCAGFIGGALTERMLEETSAKIVGIDNLNDYYDIGLKEYRLERIARTDNGGRFLYIKGDISSKEFINKIFEEYRPAIVIHLAAQAGVRYSIENPDAYIQSNIIGFYNMVEMCRHSMEEGISPVKHFVYASSSSVYGNNKKVPYSTVDMTDQPVSLYAATKKANEVIAYAYSKLYRIPMTGMRFFTVYGPAGRPDMAYFKFTEKICTGKNIRLYNFGKNKRDFTYIDDITRVIKAIAGRIPDEGEMGVRHKIYNIGNHTPVDVMTFVKELENALKDKGVISESVDIQDRIELAEAQAGDVEITYADVSALETDFGFRPETKLKEGLKYFAEWYKSYYG